MKVTSQTIENRQVEITVEVDDNRVQQELRKTAKKVAGQTNIPGFRKGKAPYDVVLRTFGKEALYREMIDDFSQAVYREAIDESDIDPYGPGEVVDVQPEPLVFKFRVPLQPVVELGDYRSLRVPFTAPEVKDEAVDNVLQDLQQRNAVMEPAGEGPAEQGQVAVVNVEGKLKPEDGGQALVHEHDIPLAIEDTTDFPFPGFIQHVVGMKVGEEKQFEMPVPDDAEDDIKGKQVIFDVKLQDLKLRHVPALDDALAQTIGEYETLDALRATIRSGLEAEALREANSHYADECVDKLVEPAHIEFPPQMIDTELDSMLERTEERLQQQKMSLDEFLNLKKQSLEAYREELRPKAERSIRRALALGELGTQEHVQVTQAEVQSAVAGIAARYGENAELVQAELNKPETQRSIQIDLLSTKIMDRLARICKGENPPVAEPAQAPVEPPAAEAPAAENLAAEPGQAAEPQS